MDENEQEFIEDFGAKSATADSGGMLNLNKNFAKKLGATARSATKRNGSPQKSTYG